jgi:hypothetical protein
LCVRQGARDSHDWPGAGAHLLSLAGGALSRGLSPRRPVHQLRVAQAHHCQRRAVLHPRGKELYISNVYSCVNSCTHWLRPRN